MWKHSTERFEGSDLEMTTKLDELSKHYHVMSVQCISTPTEWALIKHNNWLIVMRRFL